MRQAREADNVKRPPDLFPPAIGLAMPAAPSPSSHPT